MTIWEKEIGYSAIPLCDWSRTVQRLESSRLSTTLKIIIIGYRLILIFFWNAFHVIKKWGKRNLKTLNQNPFLRPLAWNWWTEINAYKVLSETKSQKKKREQILLGSWPPLGLNSLHRMMPIFFNYQTFTIVVLCHGGFYLEIAYLCLFEVLTSLSYPFPFPSP